MKILFPSFGILSTGSSYSMYIDECACTTKNSNLSDGFFAAMDILHPHCGYFAKVKTSLDPPPGTRCVIMSWKTSFFFLFQHGFIHTNSIQYFIEPLRREPISPEGHHKHVVYRRSALPLHLDPVIASHINKRSAKDDDSCGVKGKLRRSHYENIPMQYTEIFKDVRCQ